MRVVLRNSIAVLISVVLVAAVPIHAQQAFGNFYWVDFHSQKDQDVIVWVTRSLAVEKWTAIREIGVEYDSALVLTTDRATPQSPANTDTFTVWNVSLTNHMVTLLIKGVNLRWLDWMRFSANGQEEPAVLYNNCFQCAADTYFTAFHYDLQRRMWMARWLHGGQGAPLWSGNLAQIAGWTQVYAGLVESNGRELIGTWDHLDNGRQRPPEDYIYRYDLDPFSGQESAQLLSGQAADAMKLRICSAQDVIPGLARGQDSPLCQQYVAPRMGRTPVVTPPANNQGRSEPPGSRRP